MAGQTGGTFPQLKTGGKMGKANKPSGGRKTITGTMTGGKKTTPCNYA